MALPIDDPEPAIAVSRDFVCNFRKSITENMSLSSLKAPE